MSLSLSLVRFSRCCLPPSRLDIDLDACGTESRDRHHLPFWSCSLILLSVADHHDDFSVKLSTSNGLLSPASRVATPQHRSFELASQKVTSIVFKDANQTVFYGRVIVLRFLATTATTPTPSQCEALRDRVIPSRRVRLNVKRRLREIFRCLVAWVRFGMEGLSLLHLRDIPTTPRYQNGWTWSQKGCAYLKAQNACPV
ncbi:uncharacterized protein ARMOST_00059 [Armillaria ostoyae]|uniref:Uncharacterized protein n=1 Tax=Armillaria ostoyae TaxID=47428 RepID=A0A284QK28_ARMOS|nr:uncharacterized protein ARMOST_00059 [Armillaria ostoyae]